MLIKGHFMLHVKVNKNQYLNKKKWLQENIILGTKCVILFELFFLVDFLHEAALSLPNSCHFYSKNDAFLQNYFAQVHCEKIQGFNKKNAFWCYFHFEWVLKLSKLSISCSVMCQKVKESDFHFPTRVYFARDYIFSMVPTKYFAHIPANFFEFNVFVFELWIQLCYLKREDIFLTTGSLHFVRCGFFLKIRTRWNSHNLKQIETFY